MGCVAGDVHPQLKPSAESSSGMQEAKGMEITRDPPRLLILQ